MTSTNQQLQRVERLERLRIIRNWALGLGLVSILVSVTAVGFGPTNNPKLWSSTYAAFAQGGLLRWAAVPLFATGIAMLVAGICVHIVVAKGDQ